MNKTELYYKICEMLPIEHPANTPFIDVLKAQLNLFVNMVSEIDLEDFELSQEKFEELIIKLKNTNTSILEAVNCISHGRHSKAVEIMHKNLCAKPLYTKTINKGEFFYRMRINEHREAFKRKDLFHIPLNKRGLVKTQRYSMPGYPCLYLGNSLVTCWEEMNRPNLSSCMFNCYRNIKDICVLSVDIPDINNWNENALLKIETIPFVIACMIMVDNPEYPYKIEYTIPQLIMECLFTNGPIKLNENLLLGIRYTSVHINKDFGFPNYIYDNLALPVQDIDSKDYCSVLKEYFEMTEPTSEELEKIKHGYSISAFNLDAEDTKLENYKCSLFGELEDYIKNYEFKVLE